MTDDDEADVLRQIARALDVSVSVFQGRDTGLANGPAGRTAEATAELLDAFAQIADPLVHRECIAFVQRCVSR